MWLPERSVTMAGTITSVVCTLIVGCLLICVCGFSCPRLVSILDKTRIAKAHPLTILLDWICTGPPKEREAEFEPMRATTYYHCAPPHPFENNMVALLPRSGLEFTRGDA